MRLPPFSVHRPRSVREASRLLADLGDDAAAYCGGTELLLAMKLGLPSYEPLADLKRLNPLPGIAADPGLTLLRAATPPHPLETSAPLHARSLPPSPTLSRTAQPPPSTL